MQDVKNELRFIYEDFLVDEETRDGVKILKDMNGNIVFKKVGRNGWERVKEDNKC